MLSIFSKIFLIILFVWLLTFPASFRQSQKTESATSTDVSVFTKEIKQPENIEIAEKKENTVPIKEATTTKALEKKEKTDFVKKNLSQETPKITTLATTTILSNVDFSVINEKVRSSLVNIICNTSGNTLSPVTGSGVIISPNGVILTNAHIGQYFLLKDFNGQKDYIECVIRTGSPAYPAYKAELVYISPDWVVNNKTVLIDKNPKGTGEFDYSFLKIVSKVDSTPLPQTFPFTKISLNEDIRVGSPALLASYPAGFLGGIAVLQYLYQSSAITKIAEIFTFKDTTVDLISVPGTILSQKGSSGGAVIDSRGELMGLISTSSNGDKTSDRDLRAITGPYINRDLEKTTKFTITSLIDNSDQVSIIFNKDIAPNLITILTNTILGK
jgi:hypothetical protein